MKLRYLDIERFGSWSNARLDGLQNGLTVIYGPNGSGKTTLMQFVRAVFYGRANQNSHRFLPSIHPGSQGGRLGVTQQDREFIVNRFWETDVGSDEATITSADGTIHDTVAFRQLLGEVGEDVFNALFTVGYREAEEFDLVVHEALADPESTQVATDELRKVQTAIAKVDRTSDRLNELLAEQKRLREEISRLTAQRLTPPAELVKVRENIARLEALIRELQAGINTLEAEIARCESVTSAAPIGEINSAGDRVKQLERQIATWRNWQREIDEQLAAVRNQLHHAALRNCDPVDQPAQIQMLQTRGSMTVIENQLDELQSRLNHVRQGDAGNGAHSIQTDLTDLRDRVFNLCDQLGQHEVLDEIATLDAESVQLQRCRNEIDRQLSIMLHRRRLLLHEYSNGAPESFRRHSHREQAACQSHSHSNWLSEPAAAPAPMVNHNLDALIAERNQLMEQLRQAQQELSTLGQRRIELERQLRDTELAQRLEALRLDLNIVEEQIRSEQEEKDVRVTTRTLLQELKEDYESRRQSVVLAEASEYLRRLTGEHHELVENSDGRTISVQAGNGSSKPLTALSRGERDQVGLSLRLALARAYTRRGTRLPLILDDVFITSDSGSAEASAILLRDFAADNQQILFFTCHEHIATMFRKLGVTVRSVPEQGVQTRPVVMPEQRQPRPIVQKVIAEPRPLMQPTPTVTAPWVASPPRQESLVVKAFKGEIDELKQIPARGNVDFEPTENWIFYTELSTPIDELHGATPDQIEELESIGVHTMEDLLALIPDNGSMQLSALTLSAEQMRDWQSQGMLSCRVPMLRRQDAHLLVRCGITTPEQLADTHPNDIHDLVTSYLRTNDGMRFVRKSNPFDRQTAINWVRWAAHARTLWHSRERSTQPPRQYQTTSAFRSTGNGIGNTTGNGNGSARLTSRTRTSNAGTSSSTRASRSTTRSGKTRRSRSETRSSTRKTTTRSATATATRRKKSDSEQERTLRFYLERDAPVEDAPSIGPRTAEHLARVGIITVRDLLNADADVTATELNHRRIKAKTIREWQAQAVLVCRVPELRGHDSQILVACDVTEPETLARFRPADLFAKVAPFVETSEGERIIRNGKKPDLDEITHWIECANQARAIRAA